MGLYHCRVNPSLGVLAGAVLLAIFLLTGREGEPSEDAVSVV